MTHFVYRAYDARGVLLYVGCTNNVHRRLKEHAHEGRWVSKCVRVTLAVYPSREQALTGEARAIQYGRPLYNIDHNPAHVEAVERRWGRLANVETLADRKWRGSECLYYAQLFSRIERLGYERAAA